MRAVNLLPPSERAGAATARKLNPWHGVAGVAALMVVVMLGMWAMAQHDAASARQAEADAQARTAAARVEVQRLAPVVALDQRRQTRETAVLALAGGRTDWGSVLQSVAGALPRQVGITTLSAQAAGATPAAGTGSASVAAPAGLGGSGSVTLSGCADSQRRVARTLIALRALPQSADVALQDSSVAGADGKGAAASASPGTCGGVTVNASLGLSDQAILDAPTSVAKGAR